MFFILNTVFTKITKSGVFLHVYQGNDPALNVPVYRRHTTSKLAKRTVLFDKFYLYNILMIHFEDKPASISFSADKHR